MAGKEIRVVAGDRGGWNALEPVLLLALAAGCRVLLYLVGICAEQYRTGKLKLDSGLKIFTDREMTPRAFVTPRHDLTVLGASQSQVGAQAAADAAIMTSAPVLAVQDLYSSLLPSLKLIDREGKLFYVKMICVSDEFAREQLLNYSAALVGRIIVTGDPQFDKTLEVNQNSQERRQKLRRAMDVDDDELVFLIAGQLNGTAEAVVLVHEMALKKKYRVRMVVRQHTRATWIDDALLERCCAAIPRSYFIDTTPILAAASEKLLAGVDFVLSGYSPTNHFGILYEMRGVVYVGTPSFRWDLWREQGLEKPLEVQLGAGWYVETPEDLVHVIEEVQKKDPSDELLRLIHSQSIVAGFNDGHAADRVWAEMQKLMGS